MNDDVPADDAGAFSAPAELGVEHYWVDHVVVIAVSGEVDMLTAPQLTRAIGAAMAARSPGGVIVDLTQVSFLASAGLSLLIDTHDDVTPNARFGVVADGVAARSITVLGLDTLITTYRTVEEAMGDIRGG